MNPFKIIRNTINFLENTEFNLKTWLISFLALISTRLLIEALLLGIPVKSFESFNILFIHTFLFFLLTYLVFLLFLWFLIKEKLKKITSFLLWGFLIIIFPPIFDKVIFGDKIYKGFYIFDNSHGLIVRFFTFFGENPDWGITWGARINILVSIFCLGGYIYFKTKNKKKTLLGMLISYFLFFILSCFPSMVVIFLEFFKTGQLFNDSYSVVAGYFMTPLNVFNIKNIALDSFMAKKLALFYFNINILLILIINLKLNYQKIISLFKNIRPPQVIFNLGLLFIGLGIGFLFNKEVFETDIFSILVVLVLVITVFSSWFFSVLVNDLNDLEIDKISNKNRPLIKKELTNKDYENTGLVVLLISLFGALLISPVIFLIITAYHLLTFVYSVKPFRLKKIIIVSNFLIALASLNFLVIGFVIFSENQTLLNFPWRIYWFLFVAYFLIIPIKDLKDIKGDKKNKIFTLPVLIGEKKSRSLLASLVFSFYLVSVFILNNNQLFPLAMFFGLISFFIIINNQLKNNKLLYWLLGVVFVYGLFIIGVIF